MFHFIRAIRCEMRTPVANLRAGVASARRIGQRDLNRAPFGRWRSVWQIEVQRVSLTNARERVLERRSLVHRHAVTPCVDRKNKIRLYAASFVSLYS
jgi:hypothetical protein